jgi:hypothetical protein
MNQSLATTALLNNQAIDHFSRGEYLDAVGKLTRSLLLVKEVMSTVKWDDDDQQQQQTANELVFCSPIEKNACSMTTRPGGEQQEISMIVDLEEAPHKTLHVDLCCRDEESSKGVRQSFVYDTPLQIWPEALKFREINHELLSELSVALMFNLALCHHLLALRAPSSSKDDGNTFARAISFYELAYEVQMQEAVELSVECTMAIVNNLGHAHQLLGNEGKAAKCFSHLLSTLLFVQSYDDENDKMDVSSSSTEGFVRNVSHLILSKKVAAAA